MIRSLKKNHGYKKLLKILSRHTVTLIYDITRQILLLAVAIVAAHAIPVPPVLAPPLVYPPAYFKVLPLHTATLPLSYPVHGYKWYYPGSVYLH